MPTLIKLRKSNVADTETDVLALLGAEGYSSNDIESVGEYRAWMTITLSADLGPRQIKKLYNLLEGAIDSVSVEVFETADLAVAKESYKDVIDQSSERMITERGFEWPPASGKRFSLSGNAQRKWMGFDMAVTKGAVTFPYNVATKDNDEVYSIADAAEASNMFLTVIGTVDAVLSLGTATKNAIAGAPDQTSAKQIALDHLTAVGYSDMIIELG
jgi:hypothetical protein